MIQIADALPELDASFSPYYGGAVLDFFRRCGLMEFTIGGNKAWKRCLDKLTSTYRQVDIGGRRGPYDLVVTCSDLVMPPNILGCPVVVVQEGMMEPINFMFHCVRAFSWWPRWTANTSATGLSHAYEKFCVASEGYRDLFAERGVKNERMVVTGIPNFDDCAQYYKNDFPYKNYVLVCTSDARETFKYENRKKFIREAITIAKGRQIIFKLHPNENVRRATREIKALAPEAMVFHTGSAEEMVANADVVVTKYSTLVYVGIALGKEVYSAFDLDELKRLCPIQNRQAAKNIADVCRTIVFG